MDARDMTAGHPAWQVALALTAVVGSLATACMMPFVAVAVMTAATMSTRRAAATVGGVWAFNQLLAFSLIGVPPTAYALGWGAALGGASVGAMLVARLALRRHGYFALTMLAAFGIGFTVYEGSLFAFALLVGGTGTFTPAIVMQILLNDALWLAGLAALHAILTRTAPDTFGPVRTLRLV